jgi:uncharacterized membrane protein YoaT (DUF817 family)
MLFFALFTHPFIISITVLPKIAAALCMYDKTFIYFVIKKFEKGCFGFPQV